MCSQSIGTFLHLLTLFVSKLGNKVSDMILLWFSFMFYEKFGIHTCNCKKKIALCNCRLEFHRRDWTGQSNLPCEDALEMLHYRCWCCYLWILPCPICTYLSFQWIWKQPCTVEWCLCRILYVQNFPNHSQLLSNEEEWFPTKLLVESTV